MFPKKIAIQQQKICKRKILSKNEREPCCKEVKFDKSSNIDVNTIFVFKGVFCVTRDLSISKYPFSVYLITSFLIDNGEIVVFLRHFKLINTYK